MEDFYDILAEILATYSLILVIVGTIGNLISFLTCVRKRLRNITTFVFLSFMSLNDIFCLYIWNLSHFIRIFDGYFQQNTSLAWCRASSLIQNISLEWSAWLLVALSVERYLSVRIKSWRICWFNSRKAVYLSVVIGTILFVLHFHMLFTNGYNSVDANGTVKVFCYESLNSTVFPAWQEVHGYLYSFVPFTLLIISNSLLIYQTRTKIKKSTKQVSDSNITKRTAMSVTIILMTIAFIAMTLPTALAGGYLFPRLIGTVEGRLVLVFCDCLSFSYHSLNFVVFLMFNKQFRLEWKNILSGCTANNVGVTSMQSTIN